MRLVVVGCSGSYPGPESPASCYLVQAEDGERTWRVLLDLGSGALGSLHHVADPLSVDAVFISHLHPDHWFDMSGYYVLRKYHPAGPQPRIPVYGPRGVAERMARGYGLPENPGMSEEFDFRSYDEHTPVTIGPLRFEVAQVAHPVEAYAIKVTHGGRSLVYSGDTGPCESLVDLSRGADLLLAEAAFREGEDNPKDLHMTGKEAAEIGVRAGVDRLVLTHVPPWYDPKLALEEARPVFDGPVELAHCHASYDI
ncbi:MAG TPA: MBL fold metallo-hydrolase [Nocardioidaceae bacterium]